MINPWSLISVEQIVTSFQLRPRMYIVLSVISIIKVIIKSESPSYTSTSLAGCQ